MPQTSGAGIFEAFVPVLGLILPSSSTHGAKVKTGFRSMPRLMHNTPTCTSEAASAKCSSEQVRIYKTGPQKRGMDIRFLSIAFGNGQHHLERGPKPKTPTFTRVFTLTANITAIPPPPGVRGAGRPCDIGRSQQG